MALAGQARNDVLLIDPTRMTLLRPFVLIR